MVAVIEPVTITSPKVLIAKVSVPVGAIAEVTKMSPELVPSTSPMRRVPAWILLISLFSNDSLPEFSDPKLIALASVFGAIVTIPEVADMFTKVLVERAMVSAFNKMLPVVEVTSWVFVNDPPR